MPSKVFVKLYISSLILIAFTRETKFESSAEVDGMMNCTPWVYKAKDGIDYNKFKFSDYRRLQDCINAHPYDTKQFPIKSTDSSSTFLIKFAVVTREIVGLDSGGELTVVIRAMLSWLDQFRRWNFTHEIPLIDILVPLKDVWYPKFGFRKLRFHGLHADSR